MNELVSQPNGEFSHPQYYVFPFEEGLSQNLKNARLPHKNVFVEREQRIRILEVIPNIVLDLSSDICRRSRYLSKLLAAVGAGLLDAALNYLWDETIGELRKRISNYDLSYFFDVAISDPERRKNLTTEEDLLNISDYELLLGARKIEIILDVGFKQLDLIRYMRNHASAAHPNHNEISAYQFVGWVETCIKEVISLPQSKIVARTSELLKNIRTGNIDKNSAIEVAAFFDELPQIKADTLASGFFGIYVNAKSSQSARDGVAILFPKLWPKVSEEQKHELGIKYGRFQANGDSKGTELSRKIFTILRANEYLPEGTRSAEIMTAIEELIDAHEGLNNFYRELVPARRLESLIGNQSVPQSVCQRYVEVLVKVFLTNSYGVCVAANPYYEEMFRSLSPENAEIVLRLLFSPDIISSLERNSSSRVIEVEQKYMKLLDIIEPKMTSHKARELYDALREFSGKPEKIAKDTNLQRLLKQLS